MFLHQFKKFLYFKHGFKIVVSDIEKFIINEEMKNILLKCFHELGTKLFYTGIDKSIKWKGKRLNKEKNGLYSEIVSNFLHNKYFYTYLPVYFANLLSERTLFAM